MTQKELNQKLFDTVYDKNIDGVREVLSLGADVNSADADGWTVLIYACANGYTDIARLLIEHGADINIRNSDGHTALDILKEEYPDKYKKLIKDMVIKARQDQLETGDSLTGPKQSILPDWNI
jgi:ankyrin repeat protein